MRLAPKWLSFFTVAWVLAAFFCASANAAQDTSRVLILNSYDEISAPYYRPIEIFKKKLQEGHSGRIIFQYADLRQRGTTAQLQVDQSIAQLLLSLYPDKPPDLVVGAGPPAIEFWIRYRATTFPESSFVAMARDSYVRQAALQPSDAIVATEFSFIGVVDNILRLLPETSRIVMVFGDSRSERALSDGARQQLEPYAGRLSLEFTNDLTIPEVQDRLAGLSGGTAVLYGIFSSDVEGVALRRYSGLDMVRAASRAPVFGAFDDQLGYGIVGGNLIQVERIGSAMAEAAQALLSKAHVPGEMTVIPLSKPRYDWRELKEWNIDFGRLPQGSEVLFKPPGFWDKYAVWVLGVVIVVVGQGVLLITLLIQRQKRRRAEQAHASLGRRLITAHEDERRLLARELHDDLSQRLARVAIDAGFARSRSGSEAADEVLVKLHSELADISKDVHDMSYRLHPSLVDDLGIVAALQSEIERLQRQVDIQISGQINEVPGSLSSEKALCVFRIAQEALQNAVKHAQARSIEIELESSAKGLLLTVRDDGVGFDLEEVNDRFSLGLSSMRERTALIGGDLTVSSRPGSGTAVTLIVPIDGMSA